MSKKGFFIVSALLLSFFAGFAGCSADNQAGGDRMTIRYAWFKGNDDDPFTNFIEEKFNVNLEYVPLQFGERKAQVNLLVTSGDLPDVTFYEGDITEWARQGLIRELPEIDASWPNLLRLKELMGEEYDNAARVDGKPYAWPKYNPVNLWNSVGFQTFVYRKDWARAVGLANEDDIYSWDEFLELARAFVEQDPGGNGSGKTIGIATNHVSLLLGFFDPEAHPVDYVRRNGRYLWGGATEGAIEGIAALKSLYDEGIFWPDFYNAKDEDGNREYFAGNLGIYGYNFTLKNIDKFRVSFANANPGVDLYDGTAFMQVQGPDGRFYANEVGSFWAKSIYNPDISDAKMEKILMIADWLASEEGTRIAMYGLEGTDWEMVDGEVVLHWEQNDQGDLLYPQITARDFRAAFTQHPSDILFSDPNTDPRNVEDLRRYAEMRNGDNTGFNYIDFNLGAIKTPNYLRYAAFTIDYKDKITELVITSDDIEADYRSWLETMAPKIDSVLAELDAGS